MSEPEEAPHEPLAPRRMESLAIRFYAVLGALALAWRQVWAGEPLWFASAEAAARGGDPVRDVATGLLAAGVVIGISYELTRHTRAGHALAGALAELLGPLRTRHVLVLAATSGLAEEAFFRGALQPRVGLVVASVVFGLVHFVPRPEFRLWTVFSVAAGFLLGVLFERTGNLTAPVVAHFTINAVNLSLLVRGNWSDPGDDEPEEV